jgi:hypothetical protein
MMGAPRTCAAWPCVVTRAVAKLRTSLLTTQLTKSERANQITAEIVQLIDIYTTNFTGAVGVWRRPARHHSHCVSTKRGI